MKREKKKTSLLSLIVIFVHPCFVFRLLFWKKSLFFYVGRIGHQQFYSYYVSLIFTVVFFSLGPFLRASYGHPLVVLSLPYSWHRMVNGSISQQVLAKIEKQDRRLVCVSSVFSAYASRSLDRRTRCAEKSSRENVPLAGWKSVYI